ncbi:MAG: hypothetical protein ACK5JJ_01460, partial [Cyanobacteriota bacterium]
TSYLPSRGITAGFGRPLTQQVRGQLMSSEIDPSAGNFSPLFPILRTLKISGGQARYADIDYASTRPLDLDVRQP